MVEQVTPGGIRMLALALAATALTACSSFGAAGPGTGAVRNAAGDTVAGADITIVDLDQGSNSRLAHLARTRSFSEVFGTALPATPLVERGDTVGVSIWEAPPAVLFGPSAVGSRGEAAAVAQSAGIPDQQVAGDGTIAIPFVGKVAAAGRTPSEIQREIASRLQGRAHDPQVLVRLTGNAATSVTVLGAVASSRRVPLTAQGERLLDILAAAGGPTEDIDKITVRVTRGSTAVTMPLDMVLLDPAQNIPMRAEDVLTVVHQPFSFIALGAVQRNAEVPFEGSGLSLAQALGRIGGLRDDRADIRGVFVFRFEDPAALDPSVAATARTTAAGKVPVIYRLDLSEAAGFFLAQDFAIRDDDVLYVSSAPGADLQKFLSTLSNVALSTIAIGNSL